MPPEFFAVALVLLWAVVRGVLLWSHTRDLKRRRPPAQMLPVDAPVPEGYVLTGWQCDICKTLVPCTRAGQMPFIRERHEQRCPGKKAPTA